MHRQMLPQPRSLDAEADADDHRRDAQTASKAQGSAIKRSHLLKGTFAIASMASSAPAVGVIRFDTRLLYWNALTTICRDRPRRSAMGIMTGRLIMALPESLGIGNPSSDSETNIMTAEALNGRCRRGVNRRWRWYRGSAVREDDGDGAGESDQQAGQREAAESFGELLRGAAPADASCQSSGNAN